MRARGMHTGECKLFPVLEGRSHSDEGCIKRYSGCVSIRWSGLRVFYDFLWSYLRRGGIVLLKLVTNRVWVELGYLSLTAAHIVPALVGDILCALLINGSRSLTYSYR